MTIEQRIEQRIAEMSAVFDALPGVVIIHDISAFHVHYMSNWGLQYLNMTLDELRNIGWEYYERFFNAEDAADYVPKILGMLERNNDEETISFFQQVRAGGNGEWQWFASATKIFMRDDNGAPLLTITTAIPIDSQHYFTAKIERLLKENEFLKKNQHLYASLTRREQQILCLMAKNQSSTEIGAVLYLSEETVKTHRRNIKKKIQAQTQYDIIQFAQAFNFI